MKIVLKSMMIVCMGAVIMPAMSSVRNDSGQSLKTIAVYGDIKEEAIDIPAGQLMQYDLQKDGKRITSIKFPTLNRPPITFTGTETEGQLRNSATIIK